MLRGRTWLLWSYTQCPKAEGALGHCSLEEGTFEAVVRNVWLNRGCNHSVQPFHEQLLSGPSFCPGPPWAGTWPHSHSVPWISRVLGMVCSSGLMFRSVLMFTHSRSVRPSFMVLCPRSAFPHCMIQVLSSIFQKSPDSWQLILLLSWIPCILSYRLLEKLEKLEATLCLVTLYMFLLQNWSNHLLLALNSSLFALVETFSYGESLWKCVVVS